MSFLKSDKVVVIMRQLRTVKIYVHGCVKKSFEEILFQSFKNQNLLISSFNNQI